MNTRELRKRLRTLGEIANDSFPYLNNGGCCVFAAAVAGELERLGVQHEVILPAPYSGDGVENISEIRQRVVNANEKRSWNDAGINFGHVAVRLKTGGRWHTYDSDGFMRGKYEFGGSSYTYVAADGGLTAKEAKALADEKRGWNSCFSRRDVRPVRKLVREVMRAPL